MRDAEVTTSLTHKSKSELPYRVYIELSGDLDDGTDLFIEARFSSLNDAECYAMTLIGGKYIENILVIDHAPTVSEKLDSAIMVAKRRNVTAPE